MEWLASPEIWVAFLTLTALEIVLGIDNIIFISILVGRLPPAQQPKARFFGLALAEGAEEEQKSGGKVHGFMGIIVQIAIIDIIFSLDSVITAVGLVQNVPVMVAAIVISVGVMMLAAGTISDFIEKHPSLKMLALSFLIVVGTVLVAESFEVHVPKGYVYFAMAFSLAVEALNIRLRGALARKRGEEPVKLRKGSPD